jgi:methyl-accepting chemotaxis protein
MKMKQERNQMTINFKDRILQDERSGEIIINYFRISLAIIYVFGMMAITLIRHSTGYNYLPWRAHAGPALFLVYSLFVLFYLRRTELPHKKFKYICVILDMTLISFALFITCTYPEIYSPVSFLSIQALFYTVLIVLGAFRYDISCAIFSGIYGGVTYLVVILANANVLDVEYTAIIHGKVMDVDFPLYNETFRILGMIVAGAITGMACKRHLALFRSMLESESQAAEASAKTMEQTKAIAKTVQEATNEIFVSSKDIFTTANNQASSVQEIESTISENTQIAADIAEKTGSVATIASKTEEDVKSGFSVLEQNITKMEDIKTKNDSVIASIVALGNKITKIRDIIKTINTITDQTKVIAFNAALEAAGAGDKGKRFSVVASEVNRLADDIATLTKQIREQVEEIQDSSSSLIISSEESADKITEGRKLIKDLEEIFREIKSGAEITSTQAQTITVATQRQQRSTEQINIAIADISQGLNNFIHSTEVATASAEALTRLIETMEKLLDTKITVDSRDNTNGN